MGSLYLTRISPNPPGKDSTFGLAPNDQLVREWVEFSVVGGARYLNGDQLFHRTYASRTCDITGLGELTKFGGISLSIGQSVRVHTGMGRDWWEGSLLHHYLGKSWYVWNNACGVEAQLRYGENLLDWAAYGPNPGERILTRVQGTNRFN